MVTQEAWLMGYISGKAMSIGVDVLKQNELPSLSLWVDNYCKTNPLDDSSDAGEMLFFELKRRTGAGL